METHGISGRAMAVEVGVGKDRMLGVLSDTKSMTTTELFVIAEALGLTASDVLRDAETRLSAGGDPTIPLRQPSTAVPPPDVALLAARTVTDRPEHAAFHQWDDVGEEPQGTPDTPA